MGAREMKLPADSPASQVVPLRVVLSTLYRRVPTNAVRLTLLLSKASSTRRNSGFWLMWARAFHNMNTA
jgi:hypothetical protein